MMTYKGYAAVIRYDDEAKVFAGHIAGITDMIHFEADNAKDLEAEFRASVDDYMEFCRETDKAPQKAASGQHPLKMPPELHARAKALAEARGMSFNALVVESLETSMAELVAESGDVTGR